MAVTPAQILYPAYDDAGVALERADQQRIDFHAVIAEVHSVAAEITKYPVQSGFHVSNHSIRNNRIVTIEGAFTNNNIAYHGVEQNFGTAIDDNSKFKGKYRNYGLNASRTMFQELEELIIKGTECRVITNLGDYLPVIWRSFNTRQQEGLVDSMEFTIVGEEVLIVEAGNETGSVPVSFTKLETGADRDAELQKLAQAGYKIGSCDTISKATVQGNTGFHIEGEDAAGQTVTTYYKFTGIDSTTGESQYMIIADPTTAKQAEPDKTEELLAQECAEKSLAGTIKNAAMQAAGCLLNEAISIGIEVATDAIDSALGKVAADLRGVVYDNTNFGNEGMSSLATAAVGCVVRSATGKTSGSFIPGESLPTGAQIIEGASNIFNSKPKSFTLTQIKCACKNPEKQDILEIIPFL